MWKAMDVFIDQIRRLYNDWDIRVMVLLSLLFQVLLQLLGNRRKFSRSVWLRIIVWFSYVIADSIAIMALGTISTKLGRIGDLSHLDGEAKLNALWAPCLLLLLGGPDSITAYSVLDNQLWLRHLVVFVAQTSVVGYVCFLAWASDCLSYLSLLLLVAGVIKYGERVWVLWQVSFDKLRNVRYKIDWYEGYRWKEAAFDDNIELISGGYTMFKIFKHIFLNQKLDHYYIDGTKAKFSKLTPRKAFKIIEIELGFMYDLLHTKAKTTYTCWGICRRLTTSTISCIVLAVFSWFVNTKSTTSDVGYPRIDVAVSFVLLATNISSEIYWVFILLASDWAQVVWFWKEGSRSYKYRKYEVRNTILQLCKQPRWTNSASQLSFFSLFLNVDERPLYCSRLLKLLRLQEKVGPYYHTQQQEITDYIKDQIFFMIKEIPETLVLRSHKEILEYVFMGEDAPLSLGTKLMEIYDLEDMIIIWHIATELCNYYDVSSSSSPTHPPDIMKARKTAMLLSRYMFYILVMYPLMLQTVDVYIKLKGVKDHVQQFADHIEKLRERREAEPHAHEARLRDALSIFRYDQQTAIVKKSDAKTLMMASTDPTDYGNLEFEANLVPITRLPFSLFGNACWLAKKLMIEGGENTLSNPWRFLLKSWLAHLIYAAYHCREEYHTQQLRRGGELLTHVWMLMVHLGLTNHYKVEIKKMIIGR